uniref:Uncharacterized protein n=1 Tax=Glossina palpalis gambiensis TaxID=67801 RepID=A0A1B0BP10_9MUSC
MLLPDETYEDYKQRLNSLDSAVANISHNSSLSTEYNNNSNNNLKSISKRPKESQIKSKYRSSKGSCASCAGAADGDSSNIALRKIDEFFNNIPDLETDKFPYLLFTEHLKQDDIVKNENSDNVNSKCNMVVCCAAKQKSKFTIIPLAEDPTFIRTCEKYIQHYKLRPDFFCQYYKAISNSNTSSSEKHSKTKSSSNQKCSLPSVPTINVADESVQRFAQRTAIYTLPLGKRKIKYANDFPTLKTGKKHMPFLLLFFFLIAFLLYDDENRSVILIV